MSELPLVTSEAGEQGGADAIQIALQHPLDLRIHREMEEARVHRRARHGGSEFPADADY